ncbi:phosphotransferase [Metarhizium robertsii ARSEF 23]|uniref:Phosphotransferase n=1 Tax=Metarhizium robertsii (strain ARSEF 23 / ATCC MYA-3075) TaxID=655844 RepID=A0A0B2XHT4_METRA|nr:phosphotransferase [Metarhizium robertsii ARSEF 23]KHO11519.1 phosphotransferase [Metarhizium robertsii ARSEF 23]
MGSDEALTSEEQLQKLRAAFDQTDGIVKNHSFQIVSLQNQLQLMQMARAEEAEERKRLVRDNEHLTTEIVYLKGRLAKLVVEFYYAQAAASPYDSEKQRSTSWWANRHNNNNNNTSSSKLIPPQEEEARPRNRVVETVADRMLAEQKSLLQDFAQMNQYLTAETRDQLNELDQAHFYDARENITDDSNNIKTEGDDGSFSLEDGLLRAPSAVNPTCAAL